MIIDCSFKIIKDSDEGKVEKIDAKDIKYDKLLEHLNVDKMEVNIKPEKAVIDINEATEKKEVLYDLSWPDKFKFFMLIVLLLIYIGLLVRGLIYEIKRIKRTQELINQLRPLMAALYELDANLAQQMMDGVKKYGPLYDDPNIGELFIN